MHYYRVRYYDEGERMKTVYLENAEAVEKILVPILVKNVDKNLRSVKDYVEITEAEYNSVQETPIEVTNENVDQSYDTIPGYHLPSRHLFIKNGVIGSRYVTPNNKVVTLAGVSFGSVTVQYYGIPKKEQIARNTEVVEYDDDLHKEFLKKPVKEEEE